MPTFDFDDSATRRAMRLSVIEAVCYAINVSFGEAYFIADGVRLGATPGQVGILVALPLGVGAVAATAVPGLLQRFGRRKPVVLAYVAIQIAAMLTLALAECFDRSSVPLLLALVCIYQATGQSAGVAWGSWYGDVVPREIRGRYFSRAAATRT